MKRKKVRKMVGEIERRIRSIEEVEDMASGQSGAARREGLAMSMGIVSEVSKAYLERKGASGKANPKPPCANCAPRLSNLEKCICSSLGAAWASRDNVLQEARIIDLWDGKPEFDSESGYYGLEGHLLATIYGMDFSLMPGQCVRVGEEGMAARDSVPSGKESRHGDCDGRREKCK